MVLTRDNKRGTGSLPAVGLLLAFVATGAPAQTQATPGNDQSGSSSVYLSLHSATDGQENRENAGAPNPDPEGRFDWATAYDFRSGVVSHDSEALKSSTGDVTRVELFPMETSAVPYLSIAPKEYAGVFNPAYVNSSYDWADLYDFSGKIAYAISKIATDRDRRVPANSVAEASVTVETDPIADLPKLTGSNGSTGRPDATILSAINAINK